jgi:hypothetical protein
MARRRSEGGVRKRQSPPQPDLGIAEKFALYYRIRREMK